MIRLIQLLAVITLISSSIQDRRVNSFVEKDDTLKEKSTNGTMPICDNGFSLHTATVACRTLNKTSKHVHIVIDTSGKSRRGLILSRDWCGGTEKNLSECTRFREGSCMRGFVQIICQEDVKVILDKQKVIVKPRDVKGYVNDNVTVSCSVRPESNRTLNWFRYEWRNDSTDQVFATSPSVTVTLKEDVTLACNAYYRKDKLTSSANATLWAYYPPPAYQTHHVTVFVGTNLNFSRLSERKDKKRISNPLPSFELRKLQNDSDVQITPSRTVRKEDGGTYILRITNEMKVEGRERNGSGVMVVHLQVLERPLSCTKDYFARPNTTVTLQCAKMNWTGDLKVNWTRGDGNTTVGNMTKSIDSVSDEKAGNYSCVFTYHNITIDGQPLNQTQLNYTCNMTLHVLGHIYDFTVLEGGNATFEKFKLNSNTSKEWYKLLKGTMNTTKEPLEFTIKNITRDQAGIYINKESMNEALQLKVMYEPEITCATRKSVERGTTLTLPCGDLHTYPGVKPNITWRRAESDNVTGTDFFFNRVDVTDDDEGVYVCNVSISMTDGWNDTKNFSLDCPIEVVVYESNDLTLTLAVVSSVFSVCVLGLTGAVVFLACRLFRRPKDKSISDPGIALTTKSTTNSTKKEKEPKRKLPAAPNMPLPNSPADLQQDVYENA